MRAIVFPWALTVLYVIKQGTYILCYVSS